MYAVITLAANAFDPKVSIDSFWENKDDAKYRAGTIRESNRAVTSRLLPETPMSVTYIEVQTGPWEIPAKTLQWLRSELQDVERIRSKVACAQEAIFYHLQEEERNGTVLHESSHAYGLRFGIISK